ncbi:hypothetical protein UABAM_01200 [Candidatus Uabimicrobium amorphum]|uniref:Uncharacterized protein n=1 Tax=Uabimicrobium amorphum TaxID=2596890 RepID=A0A5S9IJU5_UABAM|nr:hypothetical protein UABAM_01200 [Candidatus Uabimicrobium amorphum]
MSTKSLRENYLVILGFCCQNINRLIFKIVCLPQITGILYIYKEGKHSEY